MGEYKPSQTGIFSGFNPRPGRTRIAPRLARITSTTGAHVTSLLSAPPYSLSVRDKASDKRDTLLKCLEADSDVQLQFEDAVLPGHSLILSMWSDVRREAVKLAFLSPESSSGKRPIIPLPGTRSKDWLKVAAFMYPNEPHVVTWDNLEALLELGDKHEMPALLKYASGFFDQHAMEVSADRTSPKSCFKWLPLLEKTECKDEIVVKCMTAVAGPQQQFSSEQLEALLVLGQELCLPQVLGAASSFICSQAQAERGPCQDSGNAWNFLQLADQFGLKEACQACISRITKNHRGSCTPENMSRFSPAGLQSLALQLVQPPEAPRGQQGCTTCLASMKSMPLLRKQMEFAGFGTVCIFMVVFWLGKRAAVIASGADRSILGDFVCASGFSFIVSFLFSTLAFFHFVDLASRGEFI